MENAVLVDTNIVSLLLKISDAHEPARVRLRAALLGKMVFISFVTLAELLYWAEKNDWRERRRAELDVKLRAFGILDPTRDTAEHWARTRAQCTASGKSLSHADLWIAAAALEHDLPLISNDNAFDHVPSLNRRSL